MPDSISVIGPGWRATDSDNIIVPDAKLRFFDAETSDARTVYSDSSLSTALGVEVSCNVGGYPVTSGNNRTLIYTGNTAYKVRLVDSDGATVWEHDNVRGALDTSDFLTTAAVADQSIVATSTSRNITVADKGKLINVDCSSGNLDITLDDASDLGDGFFVGIRHDGTANAVRITGDGVETIGIPGVNTVAFSLTGRGHAVWITCDGTQFKANSEMPPLIAATTGIIKIADRLSTPPGSPDPGARYIVGSSPTGDWSGFAEHDIAEAGGFGTWFSYTPATDCGWLAYVQDEDAYYVFSASAWDQQTFDHRPVALTDQATVTWDWRTQRNATLSISSNRTLSLPSNAKTGVTAQLYVTATGADRTLTLEAGWVLPSGFSSPLTIVLSSHNVLSCWNDGARNWIVPQLGGTVVP